MVIIDSNIEQRVFSGEISTKMRFKFQTSYDHMAARRLISVRVSRQLD